MPMMTIEQFRQLELKVGTITQAQDHPNADRLLVLTVDVGGVAKQIVAGIRGHYQPADLVGKSVVVVDNMEPATIRGVESQGMLLAASNDTGLAVLVPEREIGSGAIVK